MPRMKLSGTRGNRPTFIRSLTLLSTLALPLRRKGVWLLRRNELKRPLPLRKNTGSHNGPPMGRC